MGTHVVYVWSCVGLWAAFIAWNIISPYKKWQHQHKRGSNAS